MQNRLGPEFTRSLRDTGRHTDVENSVKARTAKNGREGYFQEVGLHMGGVGQLTHSFAPALSFRRSTVMVPLAGMFTRTRTAVLVSFTQLY